MSHCKKKISERLDTFSVNIVLLTATLTFQQTIGIAHAECKPAHFDLSHCTRLIMAQSTFAQPLRKRWSKESIEAAIKDVENGTGVGG